MAIIKDKLRILKRKKYDPKSKRIELVEKYGYDVKFAAHAYRLGAQCCLILMDKDNFTPRLNGPALETTLDMREGYMNFQAALMHLDFMNANMLQAKEFSKLPDTYDTEKANEFFTNFMLDYILENYE